MNKKILVFLLILITINNLSFASPIDTLFSAKDIAEKIGFAEADTEHVFDNGLVMSMIKPIASMREGNFGIDYYSFTSRDEYIIASYTASVNGIMLSLKNTTNQVLVIKWAESAITSKSFSGIPFLDGMKYKDAGNPSATPDSIITPGQTLVKQLNISSVEFVNSNWRILSEPMPKEKGLNFSIVLKVIDSNNNVKYCNVTSPLIIVKTTKIQ